MRASRSCFLNFPVTTRVQSLLVLVVVLVKWKLRFPCNCPVSKTEAFKKNNKCQKACGEIMRADNTGCDSSETRELSPVKLGWDQVSVIHQGLHVFLVTISNGATTKLPSSWGWAVSDPLGSLTFAFVFHFPFLLYLLCLFPTFTLRRLKSYKNFTFLPVCNCMNSSNPYIQVSSVCILPECKSSFLDILIEFIFSLFLLDWTMLKCCHLLLDACAANELQSTFPHFLQTCKLIYTDPQLHCCNI